VSQSTEIRQRESDDILRDVAALEHQIWELRFQEGSEKAGDPSKIREKRRQVARLLTVLRERELGIERDGNVSALNVSVSAEQGEDQ
jgi:large subunit ribosomal protein L29